MIIPVMFVGKRGVVVAPAPLFVQLLLPHGLVPFQSVERRTKSGPEFCASTAHPCRLCRSNEHIIDMVPGSRPGGRFLPRWLLVPVLFLANFCQRRSQQACRYCHYSQSAHQHQKREHPPTGCDRIDIAISYRGYGCCCPPQAVND